MIENARGALDGISGEELDAFLYEERVGLPPLREARSFEPAQPHHEVYCACGTSILFGTLAERADPMCSSCLAALAFFTALARS